MSIVFEHRNPRVRSLLPALLKVCTNTFIHKFIVRSILFEGLGEALAEHYHRHCISCERIILISRNKDKLETIRARLGERISIYACDVTDADKMKEILNEIHRLYGRIDILFANAGVSYRQLSLKKTFDQAVRETLDVNIMGVINSFLPLIEMKGVHQIALISSQAAYATLVSPIYGASKQCLVSLGYDFRRILAKDEIAVNIVSPGPIRTPMLTGSYSKSVKRGVDPEVAAKIIADGLRLNLAEIVFPATTGIFQYMLSYLPLSVAEVVASFLLGTK